MKERPTKKKARVRYCCAEPPVGGRPHLAALSGAEMEVLVVYHLRQIQRIQKLAGAMVTGTCQMAAKCTPQQQLNALEECQRQIAGHRERARGLKARLEGKGGKES